MATHLEMSLALQLRHRGLPEPEHQFRFHPKRLWRFDLCFPDKMLAVEIDGGQYIQGRHQRPEGFAKDAEKCNEAVLLGWRVLRFATSQVNDGSAVDTVARALEQTGCGR